MLTEAFFAADLKKLRCTDSTIADFVELLNLRGEISKLFGSIDSCTAEKDDNFVSKTSPIITTMDDLEEIFSTEIRGTISSAYAEKPNGIKKEVLAKLWNVNEELAQGVLHSTTQFNRQSAENTLSINFSTNYQMLRYR